MNKTELIDAIAQKTSMSKVDSRKALTAFFEIVSETLNKGEKVSVVGFGTFYIVDRAARTARNPSNGAIINVPAKKFVKFKSGAQFK